ncbi:unnamed protein product [Owenia fusiformis]|uniref:Uncharacterized protein n=1 Tax=Owenia fusiformis TaxID=6347 RepID=A0A8J1TCQ0_OWEFU|nr:unnamed protein product [Owenia fusiformis]
MIFDVVYLFSMIVTSPRERAHSCDNRFGISRRQIVDIHKMVNRLAGSQNPHSRSRSLDVRSRRSQKLERPRDKAYSDKAFSDKSLSPNKHKKGTLEYGAWFVSINLRCNLSLSMACMDF